MMTQSTSTLSYLSSRAPFALFSVGAIALLLTSASGAGATYEEPFEEQRDIAGERVTIEHSHGNIQIRGWDRDDLKITGKKVVRARDLETAENFANSMKVEISENRGEIEIKTIRPKQVKAWRINDQSIHYELFVPNNLPVEVDSEHGNVSITQFADGISVNGEHGNLDVEEIGNYVEVEHEHGNVSIAGIEGVLEVQTEHGNLDIQSITGTVEVEHEHGKADLAGIDGEVDAQIEHSNVEISDVNGPVSLEHEHGRVSLKNLHGDLEATKDHGSLVVEGVDGDVSVDVEHANTRIHATGAVASTYRIEAEHSDIRLILPHPDKVSYSLKTEHGRINTTLPINIAKGKDWQAATSQDGNPNVVVSADHGDISIE